jgi:hypothetical protein
MRAAARLLWVFVIGCGSQSSASIPSGDAKCREDASQMSPTRLENVMATMDSLCDAGHFAFGCTEWGDALETGRCGLPRDRDRALRFYQRACTTEHYAPACNAVQRMNGVVTTRNL